MTRIVVFDSLFSRLPITIEVAVVSNLLQPGPSNVLIELCGEGEFEKDVPVRLFSCMFFCSSASIKVSERTIIGLSKTRSDPLRSVVMY